MEKDKFDYIFAGFGLSGMSLIHELSKNAEFAQKKILIIDHDAKKKNDRTWSFWSEKNSEFNFLARKSWKIGVFYALDGSKIPLNLEKYGYHTIQGVDFYQYILKHLQQFPNITFVQDRITSVAELGIVQTEQNEYQGDLVFKSYFCKEDFDPSKSNYFLWQHFYGYVIKTPEPKFNDQEFTLMDYRFSDSKRTNFFYILPYSDQEALVEFTEFSAKLYTKEEYKTLLENYIRDVLKIADYEIKEVEYNAIPMTDFQLPMLVSKHVINIGSLAGYVKPSSGYAFTRTLQRNKVLADHLNNPSEQSKKRLDSTQTYKAFDNAVLYLMQNEKVHGGLIFASLFQKLDADFVFRFLDEKANLPQLFRIMWSSPKKMEFIKYFLKHRGR